MHRVQGIWLVVATALETWAVARLIDMLSQSPLAPWPSAEGTSVLVWAVISGLVVVLLAVVGVTVVQWRLFFRGQTRLAVGLSLVPTLAVVGAWLQPAERAVSEALGLPNLIHEVLGVEPEHELRFTVVAPGLSPDSTVCVAGSPRAWGPWRPDGMPLHYRGDGVWEGVAALPTQTLEYKFTLGTWANEALDARGLKRPNSVLDLSGDTVVVDTVRGWSDAQTEHHIVGQITGRLDTLGTRTGPGLLAREVWVWVPPQTEPPTRIGRILLMHDGQNVVDPHTANFGVDWGVDECLDTLVRNGTLPRTLLVTVACTAERGDDYGPGPQGRRYVDWLVSDLLPEVRDRYAVASSAPVTVAGASMGGLISFVAAERHPDVFASAICMSPAFAYAGFSYPDTLRGRSWLGHAVPLWIDNGTVGLEEQLQPGVDAMGALLDGLDQPHTVRIYRGARHFEPDWGARMDEALRWVQDRERGSGL